MTATKPQNGTAFRSPRRVSITLPWTAYQCLQSRCDDEGRSLSNLAAFLIESSLAPGSEAFAGRGDRSGHGQGAEQRAWHGHGAYP